MFYSLVNLEGKTLDSFRDADQARDALRAAVRAQPELAEELLLLSNTDEGEAAGPSQMFADLLPARLEWAVTGAPPVGLSGLVEKVNSALGYVSGERPAFLGRELAFAGVGTGRAALMVSGEGLGQVENSRSRA